MVGATVVEEALEAVSPLPLTDDAAVLGVGEGDSFFDVAGEVVWSDLSVADLFGDSVEPAWSGTFILSE